MKTKKLILRTMIVSAVMVFLGGSQAGAVLINVDYVYEVDTGYIDRPNSATTSNTPSLVVEECPYAPLTAWRARGVDPYAFAYSATISLPIVGETFNGGLFDQTFQDTTRTHEEWHLAYTTALLNRTYGALEIWSASYVGGWCSSPEGVIALGWNDMNNALALAQSTFYDNRRKDVTDFEQTNGVWISSCHIEDVDGVPTWRSVNPDWGQEAVAYAHSFNLSFITSPGCVECIPEPSVVLLVIVGAAVLQWGWRRQRASTTASGVP